MVEKICSAIGIVCEVSKGTDVEGDGFIRVGVTMDISQPLCRGRVISQANGKNYGSFSNMC